MQIMIAQMENAADWLLSYIGNGWHVVLLVLAVVYILFQKQEHTHRRLLAGYVCLFTVIYFCPPISWMLTRFIGEFIYWRMLWTLPLPLIVAYVMVKVWAKGRSKWQRAVLLVLFAGSIIFTGENVYLAEGSPYEKAVNWQKVPSSPAAICDVINANREEGEHAMLAAPSDMVGYIRQYDGSIEQIYGRRGKVRPGGNYVIRQLKKEKIAYYGLTNRLREMNCNFIALPEGEGRERGMKKRGFEKIGQVGSYVIYKDMQPSL